MCKYGVISIPVDYRDHLRMPRQLRLILDWRIVRAQLLKVRLDDHRCSLTLWSIARRQLLRLGDQEVVGRWISGLSRVVRRIGIEPEEILELRGAPARETGRLGIETANEWCLALLTGR